VDIVYAVGLGIVSGKITQGNRVPSILYSETLQHEESIIPVLFITSGAVGVYH
jgi:hypothetical protein